MSHEQILNMLKRQVASEGGASAGAMSGGAYCGGAMAGAMSGGYKGQKAVNAVFKNRLGVLKLAADRTAAIAQEKKAEYLQAKEAAYTPQIQRTALRQKIKASKFGQYNKPGASTAQLHAALEALNIFPDMISKTRVSSAKPRKSRAKPKAAVLTEKLNELHDEVANGASPEVIAEIAAEIEQLAPDTAKGDAIVEKVAEVSNMAESGDAVDYMLAQLAEVPAPKGSGFYRRGRR